MNGHSTIDGEIAAQRDLHDYDPSYIITSGSQEFSNFIYTENEAIPFLDDFIHVTGSASLSGKVDIYLGDDSAKDFPTRLLIDGDILIGGQATLNHEYPPENLILIANGEGLVEITGKVEWGSAIRCASLREVLWGEAIPNPDLHIVREESGHFTLRHLREPELLSSILAFEAPDEIEEGLLYEVRIKVDSIEGIKNGVSTEIEPGLSMRCAGWRWLPEDGEPVGVSPDLDTLIEVEWKSVDQLVLQDNGITSWWYILFGHPDESGIQQRVESNAMCVTGP